MARLVPAAMSPPLTALASIRVAPVEARLAKVRSPVAMVRSAPELANPRRAAPLLFSVIVPPERNVVAARLAASSASVVPAVAEPSTSAPAVRAARLVPAEMFPPAMLAASMAVAPVEVSPENAKAPLAMDRLPPDVAVPRVVAPEVVRVIAPPDRSVVASSVALLAWSVPPAMALVPAIALVAVRTMLPLAVTVANATSRPRSARLATLLSVPSETSVPAVSDRSFPPVVALPIAIEPPARIAVAAAVWKVVIARLPGSV